MKKVGNTRWWVKQDGAEYKMAGREIQDADVWKIAKNKKMAGIKDGKK